MTKTTISFTSMNSRILKFERRGHYVDESPYKVPIEAFKGFTRIYNSSESKLRCFSIVRECFLVRRFGEGFGSMFGGYLGMVWGHVWEVVAGIPSGVKIVLGKVFRRLQTYKQPIDKTI